MMQVLNYSYLLKLVPLQLRLCKKEGGDMEGEGEGREREKKRDEEIQIVLIVILFIFS